MDISDKNKTSSVSASHDLETSKLIIVNKLNEIADIFLNEELNKEFGLREHKVNWTRVRTILSSEVRQMLCEEWNEMWETENIPDLHQRFQEIIANTPTSETAWRPTTGDIASQIRQLDAKLLLNQKNILMEVVLEKEQRIAILKEKLTATWAHFRSKEQEIQEQREIAANICKDTGVNLENFRSECLKCFGRTSN